MLVKEFRKALHLVLSLPKTIVFNAVYFGFRGALRFPVIVSYRVALANLSGIVMDHDFHALRDGAGTVLNDPRAVRLDGRVWLGCNVHVLKGTRLAAGMVVGAGSVVTGEFDVPCCVVAGNPARVVKRGIDWTSDA